jgi:hypothetical protein
MQQGSFKLAAGTALVAFASHTAAAGVAFGLLSDGRIFEIDLASNAAPVRRVTLPNAGTGFQGLEMIPGTRTMLAVNYGRNLFEVNMDTWAVRSLGTLMFPSGDFSAFTKDLSWNPATGTLETLCVTNNQPSIYRVDVANLRLTRVGIVTGMNGLWLGLAHDATGRRAISPQASPVRIHDLAAGTSGSFTAVPRAGTLTGFDFRALSLDYAGTGKLYTSSSTSIVEVTAAGTMTNVRAIPFGVPLEDIAIVPAPASLFMLGMLAITPRRRR